MDPFPGLEHRPFDVGDGPATAVAVHGFPGTPAEMRPVGEALASIGWRVRAPLLPGFGPEWHTLAKRSWTEWRDTVAAEVQHAAQAGDQVMLVGFSMGAALVLSAIHDAGVKADALVLLAPLSRFADRRAALLPLAKRLKPKWRPYADADFDDPRVRADLTRQLGGVDLDDPATRERLRNDVTVPTAAVDQVRRAGLRAWRIAPKLPEVPTLVVQGERDTTVPPQGTIELLRRLPGEPLRLFLPDADHSLVFPDRPGHMEMLRSVQRFGHERLGRLDVS